MPLLLRRYGVRRAA